MPKIRLLLVAPALMCSLLTCLPTTRAQQNPASPSSGVTLQHPTDNGYADLLAAVDLVRTKPMLDADPDAAPPPPSVFDKAQQPGATLADKRAAVHDPRFRQAMDSLHAAFGKPTLTPPVWSYSESIPDMAGLRNLSRLLSIQEYVQLADGSTGAVLDTLEMQIALGDATQHWGFISTLTGQVVIAIGVSPIVRHLDRLSAEDCARLLNLLRAERNAPNPAIDGLHAESIRAVADFREVVKALSEAEATNLTSPLNSDPLYDETPVADNLDATEVKEVEDLLKQKGAASDAFIANVSQRIAALNESAIAANLEPSAAAATSAQVPSRNGTDTITEKMAGFFAPKVGTVGKALDRTAVSRAGLQLLAVGASVTHYRWEHNALPPSLDALQIGALATDPFTQGAIVYTRSPDGRQFTLSCAGPLPRDENGKVLPNGKRTPITLP